MLDKIKALEEENAMLKKTLERKLTSGSITACETIRGMIYEFVDKEVGQTTNRSQRSNLIRKIVDDMKWDLRIRTINDFKAENISRAKGYLATYKINEYYYKNEF